jgi:DNA-binding winged helix-turn-helix (wHTH) protein
MIPARPQAVLDLSTMKCSPKIKSSVHIGPYLFCFNDNSLTHEKQKQFVQPKVMELVRLLVEEQGETVSREKIEASLWPGAVVGLDSVNNTVARLRRLLNDNPRDPIFVETIPRIGYRLMIQKVFRKPLHQYLFSNKVFVPISALMFCVLGFTGFHYKNFPDDQPKLHKAPNMQREMLAKNVTVSELMEDYDIILKARDPSADAAH